MSRSRPSSQALSSHSSSKPAFQTKMKPRIRGLSNLQDQFKNTNFDIQNKSMILDSSRSSMFTSQMPTEKNVQKLQPTMDPQFNKTLNQLTGISFSQHCSEGCVCSQCLCGRHLCKFNNIKPDLSKSTVYKKDFVRKSFTPTKVIIAQQYDKLNGPHLEMNSTQRTHFTSRSRDMIERPKPEDLLKSQGPLPGLTTYSSLFPGHKGPNQYIKPTDKYIREKFPLRSKSTYTDNFIKKNMKKDDYQYFNDQLKTGGNWYGHTSYGKFYENPNPEYHAKKVKIIEKREENPGFKHQYETVYKNEYDSKQTAICGAKILLQTQNKGFYSKSKDQFGENSDFKAMSPEYQAFSTSKFSFA